MADISTTPSVTAQDHKKLVEQEYGQYVATEAIHIDGALAFAEGHPVPVQHVKKFGLDKSGAVKSTTKDSKGS